MTAIKLAAQLIRVFEGYKLHAYWDATAKLWTIGFGHTKNVKEGDVITHQQAEEFLKEDMEPVINMLSLGNAVDPINSIVKQAVLMSFAHNCGVHALARVLSGDIKVTEKGFITPDGQLYGNSSGGKILLGLRARRLLEAALYLAG